MKILPIFVAAILTIGVQAAPSISLSGGGTNGTPLTIDFLQDVTFALNPGASASGFEIGIKIPYDLFSEYYGADAAFQLLTSPGAEVYQTSSSSASSLNVGRMMGFSYLGSLVLAFSSAGSPEYTLSDGGYITFKQGTLEISNANVTSTGYYVLNQQNSTLMLTQSSVWGSTELGTGFDSANFQIVPEPSTYALFGLGVLSLLIAYRRRAA